MAKNLVIVESPSKAKTISQYLGSDYIVRSSVGHIRDLPKKSGRLYFKVLSAAEVKKLSDKAKQQYKKQLKYERLYARMGVYPNREWQAEYQVIDGKNKVVNELKQLSKKVQKIYLATDLDREGEAIAWHIKQVIGNNNDFVRVRFNEITKNAILEAFKNPTDLSYNRINAQQVRRFLDRIVGFMLSPLLWEKVARGLSAGRVQSVAVKLLVEQEEKIRAFIPEEYWRVFAHLKSDGNATEFELTKYKNKKVSIANQTEVDAVLSNLKQQQFVVADIQTKQSQSRPLPPFITSTLQQSSHSLLGYGVKRTMGLAQKLYDAGFITYMRTGEYTPDKPNYYKGKQNSQEAHEAIRPTYPNLQANQIQIADPAAKKLYQLIWQRFIACQMQPAKIATKTVVVNAGDYQLTAKGKTIIFDGYLSVWTANNKDDVILPNFIANQQLQLVKLKPSQHFTKGPNRYSEATLVKELEKLGIGRPSTYASIISTIQERGYVKQENKSLIAEKIAEIVTRRLQQNFSNLMSYDFTARLEEVLDKIALNETNWKSVLDHYYKEFISDLEKAEVQMLNKKKVATQIKCPKCQKALHIRNAASGMFLGCAGYELTGDEQCKYTQNLTKVEFDDKDQAKYIDQLKQSRDCQQCNKKLIAYHLDQTTKLHICSQNPDCDAYAIEQGQFDAVAQPQSATIPCDKCDSEMELKEGRFGQYFACLNAEHCKNTRKVLKNGQPAPPKMTPITTAIACDKVKDIYLLRDGVSGLFLAASQFPKFRESRAPLVSELLPIGSELPEKYQFLLQAKTQDEQGNNFVVRFNKKMNAIYIRAESNNKPTGAVGNYDNGKWHYSVAKKSATKPFKKKSKKVATTFAKSN